MLRVIKSDVLCGFWDGGEVREFLTYVSDSEESDYDDSSDDDTDTNNGPPPRVLKRGLFRVVNPSPDGYDSDISDGGGASIIFPGPDDEHYRYRHAHLRDFSQTAIKQYNQSTGNRFEFVELVEASVHTVAFIVVIFKACRTDDPMVTISFKAKARSTSNSLTHSYHIETVAPLHSKSLE